MQLSPRPLALCAAMFFGAAALAQQPPPPPPAFPAPMTPGMAASTSAAPVVSGRVQRWLTNPNGDVDGFLLADGTQVAFPPHLSANLLQSVKVGDTVEVTGWRAPNVQVMRATRVRSGGSTVVDQPPAPGAPPRPPEPGSLTAMSTSGRVERVLYTPEGDANGVLLDSGGIVRFPPHIGGTMAPSLQPGSVVFAKGWGSRGAQGSALEATAIGTSADTLRELFAGPGAEPPPPDGGHRPPGQRGPRGMRPAPPPPPSPMPAS